MPSSPSSSKAGAFAPASGAGPPGAGLAALAAVFGAGADFFGGGFAAGGYIPPGKWGMTGERGPEPVFGGRTGATVVPNGPTVINKVTNIYYQPRTVPSSVTSRRSTRESFEALLAFAR